MLTPLNEDSLEIISENWLGYFDSMGKEDFSGQYRQMLGAAKTSLSDNTIDGHLKDHYYTLKPMDGEAPSSLLQIFKVAEHSRREYWKILAVRSHPSLDSRNQLGLQQHIDRHGEVANFVVNLFTAAILAVNSEEINADRIKILGNMQIDSHFFEAVKNAIESPEFAQGLVDIDHGVHVSTHNRWLQIEAK